MRKIEYRDFKYIGDPNTEFDPNLVLTIDQALEDLNEFSYIFKNGYILYEKYNINDAIDIKIEKAKSEIMKKSQISIDDFGELLYSCISNIIDLHGGINYGTWKSFGSHSYFFYSNVIVRKIDDKYYYYSGINELNNKSVYTDIDSKLFKIISNDDSLYCVGMFSEWFEDHMSVAFDNKEYDVSLFCSNDCIAPKSCKKYDCAYFNADDMISILSTTNELFIAQYGESSKLIFDFRNNNGGFPEYVKLLSIIYDYQLQYTEYMSKIQSKVECKQIISPYVVNGMINALNRIQSNDDILISTLLDNWNRLKIKQKENPSCYYVYPDDDEFIPIIGNNPYKGELIILINRDSVSAGEAICGYLYKYFNNQNYTVIGENSRGALTTGDVTGVYLCNSNIFLGIPTTLVTEDINAINFMGEGKGFYPKYWLRNTDELILYLTR